MMIKRRQFLIGAGSVAALASVGVAMPAAAVVVPAAEAATVWKDGFARLLVGGKVDAELPVRFGIRLQPGGGGHRDRSGLGIPIADGRRHGRVRTVRRQQADALSDDRRGRNGGVRRGAFADLDHRRRMRTECDFRGGGVAVGDNVYFRKTNKTKTFNATQRRKVKA
jgi:hypothetical protein